VPCLWAVGPRHFRVRREQVRPPQLLDEAECGDRRGVVAVADRCADPLVDLEVLGGELGQSGDPSAIVYGDRIDAELVPDLERAALGNDQTVAQTCQEILTKMRGPK
jgi:hypothetical protein